MSDFDIFNLDNESFVKQEVKKDSDEEGLYKPYPELGKDGIYKSLIRFLPNVANPKKSKVHQYYVWLKDPVDGKNFKALCPSTVGKKSILKDLFWKLKNSASAKDQELSRAFARKEDFYSLVQIVRDANKPELEGKIMYLKFGRKVNDLIEQQIKPEFGNPSNPYDLIEGKNFGLHVRKVGDWNNYDLCQFVGDKSPLIIDGTPVEKTAEGAKTITDYLKTGPQDLEKFDYKDWTDSDQETILRIIRNTVPDGRLVSEIIGSGADSRGTVQNDYHTEAKTSSSVTSHEVEDEEAAAPKATKAAAKPAAKSAPSLDDLYNDL